MNRAALRRALAIQRRCELVLLTGWTFDQLDDQSSDRVAELVAYHGIKSLVEREAERMTKRG